MFRKEWLIGSITLTLGIMIGIGGYALFKSPADGESRLTGIWSGKQAQPTSGAMLNPSPEAIGENGSNPAANSSAPYPPTDTPITSLLPGLNDPVAKPQEGNKSSPSPSIPMPGNSVPNELAQKISSDYKQDIALFFEAWKSRDMVAFRSSLGKAYKGELFEKHARQAEQFIIQGIGLEISQIRFESVNVESANDSSATLTAKYHYVAQDYNVGEQVTEGVKSSHAVKVRVNLIRENTRWLITGETVIP